MEFQEFLLAAYDRKQQLQIHPLQCLASSQTQLHHREGLQE